MASRRSRDRFAHNTPPQGEPWIWFTREMLASPAWRKMTGVAKTVLERVMIEHMEHAGTMNGELVITYDDFVDFGIRRRSIREAIDVAKALGFLDVVIEGKRSYGNARRPTEYGLTWMGRNRMPPSNRWQKLDMEAAQIAVEAVRKAHKNPPLSGKKCGSPVPKSANAGGETAPGNVGMPPFGPSGESAPTYNISGRAPVGDMPLG